MTSATLNLPVAERFQRLLLRIAPLSTVVVTARGRIAAINARLLEVFDVRRTVAVGSYAKDTAIRHHSDFDLFAVLPRDAARWGGSYVASGTLLRNVRDELRDRYHTTEIRRDGQAVVLGFQQGDAPIDVVPALYERPLASNLPLYRIPDGADGWLFTSPDTQAAALANEDHRSSGKLVRTVRLIKFWANTRTPAIPLLSYHLELVLVLSGACVGIKSYATTVGDAFGFLAARAGAALNDPYGISGRIAATRTDAQRQTLATALLNASSHSRHANEAEARGKTAEAIRQWSIVFNGQFPV